MRSPRDPAGDPERRLAATASGSRERRPEATGVPKQPATSSPINVNARHSLINRVISALDTLWLRIIDIIFDTNRWFPG